MRPRPFPDSTSETVDCETPARRATSTLVTRVGALISAILGAMEEIEEVVAVAGRDLALLRPRDAEALLDEHAFEQEEYLPYWAELWPSALALARFVGGRALHAARAPPLGGGPRRPPPPPPAPGGGGVGPHLAPPARAEGPPHPPRDGPPGGEAPWPPGP